MPWSCVRTLEAGRLDVLVPSLPGTPITAVTWLASTVLDHELIDVEGKRVVRVGDVILDRTAGGLAAVGVEIGGAAVLRRVGLRRLAARLSQNLIPVSAIHPPGALHTPLTLETGPRPAGVAGGARARRPAGPPAAPGRGSDARNARACACRAHPAPSRAPPRPGAPAAG